MISSNLKRGLGFEDLDSSKSDLDEVNLEAPSFSKSNRCQCERENFRKHCLLSSYYDGLNDGETFQSDLTVKELINLFRRRCLLGYHPRCAWSYVEGLLVKLNYILTERGGHHNGL